MPDLMTGFEMEAQKFVIRNSWQLRRLKKTRACGVGGRGRRQGPLRRTLQGLISLPCRIGGRQHELIEGGGLGQVAQRRLGAAVDGTISSLDLDWPLYDDQGRYGEAEPLYRRALVIRENSLGPDHPDAATSIQNLAGFYAAQGQYDEAEPLELRGLSIRERTLGPEHPFTATSLNNLATVHLRQGRLLEADLLFRRALNISEAVQGSSHPDTATSLHNLAGLYVALRDHGQANPLYRRALAIREEVLGKRASGYSDPAEWPREADL